MGSKKNEDKVNKYTKVLKFHFVRFAYRSILFVAGVIWYFRRMAEDTDIDISRPGRGRESVFLYVIWGVFMAEMILRMIPSEIESPGCRKVFRKSYVPTGKSEVLIEDNHRTFAAAIVWILPNALFGALYLIGIFNQGIMLLICLAYSICDLCCVLFFCPFQMWFLKSKCCATCRIYNWDYIFLFTPFIFIPGIYTWSLLLVALIILIRWEVTFRRHPERFSENTNASLKCENCNEKLCLYKKHLTEQRKEVMKSRK